MNFYSEILGVVIAFAAIFLLARILGRYMSAVYKNQPNLLDFLKPLERRIFRFIGVNPDSEFTWKQNLFALLITNGLWIVYGFIVLIFQGDIPFLNPDHIGSMDPSLAFHTASSFATNTQQQHYSGETGLSYFSQLFVIQLFQFTSAASAIAILVVLYKAFISNAFALTGNFFTYFIKTVTRVLFPLAVITSVILVFCGSPMTFNGADTIVTLQGDSVNVARGPVAALVAIKQIGTNGGGFMGVNSAHPFENPDYLSNLMEHILILLIAVAQVFMLGYFTGNRKFSRVILGVMTGGFLLLAIPCIVSEMNGNTMIDKMGIDQSLGNMEGKEIRFGAASSALWGVSSTNTSNGSVNSMHDSFTPLGGGILLFDMMINSFFGGVGVGMINFYVFIIIALFIGSLMVGRTPELLGKKIEIREMKLAALIVLLHPFLTLSATALASYTMSNNGNDSLQWLNNPGYHGFSQMLYEFTSASANNGSGFEGLGDNTFFWNIACGIVLLLGRYLPIIAPIAIAGMLAEKKMIPHSSGSIAPENKTFAIFLFFVILLLTGLSFLPALSLGPLAEYFSMN